jgi:hypothetical protein
MKRYLLVVTVLAIALLGACQGDEAPAPTGTPTATTLVPTPTSPAPTFTPTATVVPLTLDLLTPTELELIVTAASRSSKRSQPGWRGCVAPISDVCRERYV